MLIKWVLLIFILDSTRTVVGEGGDTAEEGTMHERAKQEMGPCRSTLNHPVKTQRCRYPYMFESGKIKGVEVEVEVCHGGDMPVTCPVPQSSILKKFSNMELSICSHDLGYGRVTCGDTSELGCRLPGERCITVLMDDPDPTKVTRQNHKCCTSAALFLVNGTRASEFTTFCSPKEEKCSYCSNRGSFCDGNDAHVTCCPGDVCAYPYTEVPLFNEHATFEYEGTKISNAEGGFAKHAQTVRKRCIDAPNHCEPSKTSQNLIYCGAYVPDRYNHAIFCDCPSKSLLIGYQCIDKMCKPCGLHKASCKDAKDCCRYHECVDGKCRQCFEEDGALLKEKESCIAPSSKGFGGCCDRKNDYCAETNFDGNVYSCRSRYLTNG